MTPQPRVSAILVTYNYGRFLRRAIESVLEQEYPSQLVQLIVVDDGSQDDTPEVAAEFGDRITYVRKQNGGLRSAINRGLAEVRGEFIALHSGDDIWLPGKLRCLTEVLEARPEVGLVYGDTAVIDAEENLLHPSFMAMAQIKPLRGRVLGALIRANFVSGGALLVRSSLMDRFAPLPNHAGWEDWWMAVRVSEVAEIEFVPRPVHGYRRHGANMNLGADQATAVKLAIEETAFRRFVLTDLQADGVSADDLLSAWRSFAGCAQLSAQHAGADIAEVLPVTARDTLRSQDAVRAAESCLAAGDARAAMRETVRALGHDPRNALAHEVLALLTAHMAASRPLRTLDVQTRSFVTFAFAEEIAARPQLLSAYADAFDGSADATLLIGLPAQGAGEAAERLSDTVAALGLDSPETADMVASVVSDGDHALIAPTVSAVLTDQRLARPAVDRGARRRGVGGGTRPLVEDAATAGLTEAPPPRPRAVPCRAAPRRSADRGRDHQRSAPLVLELVRARQRRVRAEVALDDPQREVDARQRPAARDHVAVVDHACVGPHVGAGRAQVVERHAVGDRRAAAQQPGAGEQHRTGADRCDHGAGGVQTCDQSRQAALVEQVAHAAAGQPAAARHDQQAGRLADAAVALDRQAVGRPDAARARGVSHRAHIQAGPAEDLEGPYAVQLVTAVEEQHVDLGKGRIAHARHRRRRRGRAQVAGKTTIIGFMPSAARHRVVVLALPGVVLLDLAAPMHLFGHCGGEHYACEVAGVQAGAVASSTGMQVVAPHGLTALRRAGTIVVPGTVDHGPPPPAVTDALRAAHRRGARVMSVCTGAFVLARAGLLDGRRATTHWASAAELAQRFPAVTVDPDVLYVDEGEVLTSAGVASGLDLCLHVIRRDHGARYAAAIARRTVVAPHRDGGQAQFIERPIEGEGEGAARLEATRAWALARLASPLDVTTLARHACVPPRTFARRFREETGTTPAQWVLDQRTLVARRLLERSDMPVEQVATECGFAGAASLREQFARRVRTTPTAYRRTFRASAAVL